MPESWTNGPDRVKRAGIPAEHHIARTKPELAVEEIDRVGASGVRFGTVLTDAGSGNSLPFRRA
jgi:SRSO17 transposase